MRRFGKFVSSFFVQTVENPFKEVGMDRVQLIGEGQELNAGEITALLVHEETGLMGFSHHNVFRSTSGIGTICSMRRYTEESTLIGQLQTRFTYGPSGPGVQLSAAVQARIAQTLITSVKGDAFAGLGRYLLPEIQAFTISSKGIIDRDAHATDFGRVPVASYPLALPIVRLYDGMRIYRPVTGDWAYAKLDTTVFDAIRGKFLISRLGSLVELNIGDGCSGRKLANAFLLTDDGRNGAIVRIVEERSGFHVELVVPAISISHLGICVGMTPTTEQSCAFFKVATVGSEREATLTMLPENKARMAVERAVKNANTRFTQIQSSSPRIPRTPSSGWMN